MKGSAPKYRVPKEKAVISPELKFQRLAIEACEMVRAERRRAKRVDELDVLIRLEHAFAKAFSAGMEVILPSEPDVIKSLCDPERN